MDLTGFSQKLQRLIKEHEQIKRENEKLKNEILVSQIEGQQMASQLAILKTQVTGMQAASKTLGENDKEEMEKRINQYIKEIDKAITLLNGE